MIVAKEQPYHQSPPGERYSPAGHPRPQARPREHLVLTLLILLVFALGILISIFYSRILITGYQITRMQKELAELEIETRGLTEEVSRLSSLERVEAVATTRLGMVKPDERQVVLVKAVSDAQDVPPEPRPAEKSGSDDTERGRVPREHHWILQALADLVIHRSSGHSG
ncbi:cell division protein FtsL [Desulfofundulus salinus]|uniref:Cell division protein FtsL n=1 Tax=Desulfofundulus salinus TaxID=2419843 RepID=A0A494WWJ6_9FIRM|nr:cell division protein FtsL [Desulfofundulus salinum]RKO67461.1 cell division protein FtsL [Desulfofundulus salinum]